MAPADMVRSTGQSSFGCSHMPYLLPVLDASMTTRADAPVARQQINSMSNALLLLCNSSSSFVSSFLPPFFFTLDFILVLVHFLED